MGALAQPSRPSASVYAPPRLVTRLEDCDFYHTIDVPGYGTIPGPWDLRGHVDAYLGGVDLRGKRVLELGTASGFLCVEMEKRGAEVVGFDVCENDECDIVSFPSLPAPGEPAGWRAFLRRQNNGWWLVHVAHGSKARVAYGDIYDIPAGIGEVDVATFGCILLHLRDPYRALESAARLVRDTIIVTDHPVHWDQFPHPPESEPVNGRPGGQRGRLLRIAHRLLGDRDWWFREERQRQRAAAAEATLRAVLNAPVGLFLPDAGNPDQRYSWWCFRPRMVCSMLGTLGFTRTTVTEFVGPLLNGRPERLFTVVAHRG
jgi:SAM-dependent methyltransferase